MVDTGSSVSTSAPANTSGRIMMQNRKSPESKCATVVSRWLNAVEKNTGFTFGTIGPRRRTETSLKEIWVKCLNNDLRDYTLTDAQFLSRVMKCVPGWSQTAQSRNSEYGKQRLYKRSEPQPDTDWPLLISSWLDTPLSSECDDDLISPCWRTETCLIELWVDCLGGHLTNYSDEAANMINLSLRKLSNWKLDRVGRIGRFGEQRIYRRID